MNSRIAYTWMPSPLGDVLLVAGDDALRGVYFHDQKYFPSVDAAWTEEARVPVLSVARRQLDEYFAGSRARFDVPLGPMGTPFQRAIWKAIAEVPCGETKTY
ncbi:MAG TPA: cysteine methyltransferase, partial [Casimicrobiaceae bacterium]